MLTGSYHGGSVQNFYGGCPKKAFKKFLVRKARAEQLQVFSGKQPYLSKYQPTLKLRLVKTDCFFWELSTVFKLPGQGSNLRMSESKSDALPLGDRATKRAQKKQCTYKTIFAQDILVSTMAALFRFPNSRTFSYVSGVGFRQNSVLPLPLNPDWVVISFSC